MLVSACVVLRVVRAVVCYSVAINFDAFLKRFGERQSPVLVRHWLGTTLRDSLSDDSLCGHFRVP